MRNLPSDSARRAPERGQQALVATYRTCGEVVDLISFNSGGTLADDRPSTDRLRGLHGMENHGS